MTFPLVPFLVAAVLSVLATHFANPFEHSRRLDTAIGVFLFVVCGVGAGLAGFFLEDTPLVNFVRGTLAIAPPVIATLAVIRQRRRLHRHVAAVFDPKLNPARLAALQTHLANKRPLQRTQDTRRAAWVFGARGQFEVAAALLSEAPLQTLPPRWRYDRVLALNDLAAYRLGLGDVEAAREALDSVEDVPRNLSGPIGAKRALLAAVTGGVEDAASMLEEITLPPNSPHLRTVNIATAHVQAGRGQTAEARQTLRALAKTDPGWLARVTTPSGPASALATALAADKDTPYR